MKKIFATFIILVKKLKFLLLKKSLNIIQKFNQVIFLNCFNRI
ncbi:hypothetical protein vBEcoMWL3_gp240c [Escherichia phage vB_EcoM_WL-3]|nr:hypothetical protein vBEcoMWL3_gp240c [Escherichia phage vB_EcoM_WL-3]